MVSPFFVRRPWAGPHGVSRTSVHDASGVLVRSRTHRVHAVGVLRTEVLPCRRYRPIGGSPTSCGPGSPPATWHPEGSCRRPGRSPATTAWRSPPLTRSWPCCGTTSLLVHMVPGVGTLVVERGVRSPAAAPTGPGAHRAAHRRRRRSRGPSRRRRGARRGLDAAHRRQAWVATMSLYSRVRSKDELLVLMVERGVRRSPRRPRSHPATAGAHGSTPWPTSSGASPCGIPGRLRCSR